jgi:hypothetical protein
MNDANNALDAAKAQLIAAQESLDLSKSEVAVAGESVNSMPEILTALDEAKRAVTTAKRGVAAAERAVKNLTPGKRRKSRRRRLGGSVEVSDFSTASGGRRKSRRRRRIQQGGGGNVFVVYKIGGPKSPDFVGVFPDLEAAKAEVRKKVNLEDMEKEEKIKPDEAGLIRIAFSELEKVHFYCEAVESFL